MKMEDHFALPVVADDGWAHERTADGKFVAMFRLDRQAKAAAHAINCHDELVAELGRLQLAYVNLLEIGRDRIRDLGGTCDPVDVMERNDPALIRARAILTKAKGE